MYKALGIISRGSKDYKAAIHYFVNCLKIAEQLGDRAGQGRAHSGLGNTYFDLGNFKAAIRHHDCDLEISKELRDRAGEGGALNNLGIAYHMLADVKRAIYYYECSLRIDEERGNRDGNGRIYANLGCACQNLGDFKKAKDYHELHLKIAKELGDRAGEANAYFSLGNIDLKQGNFEKALEYHECTLEIAKELGDRVTEGATYGNLGNDYAGLGNCEKAIDCHRQHLEIVEELGNRAGIGQAYGNLGNCYRKLGETKTAIDYYDRCLKIAQEVGNKKGEGNTYGNLGNAYLNLGEFDKARDHYERELNIFQEIRHRAEEGDAYCSLGITYHYLGNFEKAEDNLERGLKIQKDVGIKSTEGATYSNLGNVYHSLGDFKKAIAYHELHLKIAQELKMRAEEGSAYANLANAYYNLEDFVTAIIYYKDSLQIAKEVGDKELVAKTKYNLGCSCEAIGFLPDALLFYHSSVKILNDLRDRLQSKDEWKISLRNLYQTVYNSLWSLLLKQGKVVEALSAAEQGRAQALSDLLEVNYGNERPYNGSGSVENTVDDTLGCLSSNTVFIAVHKRQICCWVIQKEKDVKLREREISCDNPAEDATTFLQSLVLNAGVEIGVRAGVRCENRSLDKLKDDVESQERSGQTASHSSEIQASTLRTLYDLVIGPIEDLIHGGDELTIVPDGPLCLAPYAALMDPRSKYLGESFRIRVIPSLSSLKLITDCPENHHCKSGALLVGDPCLEEVVFGSGMLSQLPSAKEEVEMIGRIINCAPLTGKEATKNKVLERISSVALVHIAAHGRMETGEIVLAPNLVPESAQVQEEDYLLTMEDVLKIKLRARLVVLSCCHSARGKIKAEGVVGIARAFLGAGARSVLVSLWAIDDEATLEFMKFFYQHLLDGRKASEALRLAMKCMRESENELFSEVKHWAPFVLIGDDVTLEFGGAE